MVQPASGPASLAREHAAAEASDLRGPRPLVAEGLGAFALTFVAAGADTLGAVTGGQVGEIARAVAPGLLVMALIYAIGDMSGAHFNPAVSLAFTLRGLFPLRWLGPYVAAQLVGSLTAAGLLRGLFGTAAAAGVSSPHIANVPALVIEAVLTCLLVIVILGTADRYRAVGPNAALAVGGTIALAGLIALPAEGISMNPARSIGPALVNGSLGDVWIYCCAPLIGAVAAVGLTSFLHGRADDPGEVEAARGEYRARNPSAQRAAPPKRAARRSRTPQARSGRTVERPAGRSEPGPARPS